MKLHIHSVSLLTVALLLAPNFAVAQQTYDSGPPAPLVDEPSRADLFQRIIDQAQFENPLTTVEEETFALKGPFVFPDDVAYDDILKQDRPPSIFGIDVSHHQGGNLDFGQLKEQGVQFVFVKASQGIRYFDPMFDQNWKSLGALAEEETVHRGAYHFLSATGDCTKQADHFVKVLKDSGGVKAGDMPPVVDIEWDVRSKGGEDFWTYRQPSEIIACAVDFLERVESSAHVKPLIYTSRSWWKPRVGDKYPSELKGYKLWLADYSRSAQASEAPKSVTGWEWGIWQFTDRSRVLAGISGPLDASIFHGTEADFLKFFDLGG